MPGGLLLPARCHASVVECIAGRAIFAVDPEVHRALKPAFAADPEIRLAIRAEAGGFRVMLVLLHFHDERVAERRQSTLIEGLRARVVRDWKTEMIDHERARQTAAPKSPARPAQP